MLKSMEIGNLTIRDKKPPAYAAELLHWAKGGYLDKLRGDPNDILKGWELRTRPVAFNPEVKYRIYDQERLIIDRADNPTIIHSVSSVDYEKLNNNSALNFVVLHKFFDPLQASIGDLNNIDVITKFCEGARVEARRKSIKECFREVNDPCWTPTLEYRIVEAKEFNVALYLDRKNWQISHFCN